MYDYVAINIKQLYIYYERLEKQLNFKRFPLESLLLFAFVELLLLLLLLFGYNAML